MPPKKSYPDERVKLSDKSTVSVSLGTDPKGSFTLEQLREYAAALGFKDSSLAGKLTATQQSDMWAKLKRFALQNTHHQPDPHPPQPQSHLKSH